MDQKPCKFYLKGNCQWGAKCRQSHTVTPGECDYGVHCTRPDCMYKHPAGRIRDHDADVSDPDAIIASPVDGAELIQRHKRARRFKDPVRLDARADVKKAKMDIDSPTKAKLSDRPMVGRSSTPIVDFVRAGAGSQLKASDVRSKETLSKAFQEIRRSRPAFDKVAEWWKTALPKLRMVRQDLVVQQLDDTDFGKQVSRFLIEQALLVDDKKTAVSGLTEAVSEERALILWWAGGNFRDLSPLSEPIAMAILGGNYKGALKLIKKFSSSTDSLHRVLGRVLGQIIDTKFHKMLDSCTHGTLPKLS